MATAPKIALRDASGFTNNLVFTTNQDAIFIQGQVDNTAADIQVSINGGTYTSDPTLVQFSLPNFTIPNPTNFPDGLPLDLGDNTILIRTIDIVGAVSGSSIVDVTQVAQATALEVQIPTGIRTRRLNGSVLILAATPNPGFLGVPGAVTPQPSTFQGFNIYASTAPGGTTGYFKINQSPVTTASTYYEETTNPIGTNTTTWENVTQKKVRIRISEIDQFGQEVSLRLLQDYDVSSYSNELKFTSSLEQYSLDTFISFEHTRGTGLNSDAFAGVADTDPLYYVVSGVYFDQSTNVEIESPYSQEVLSLPLILDTSIPDLPQRNQVQVRTDFIRAIERVNLELSLIPGSTTRDASIDPFASEAERIYFLVDFVHKCQSFLTLIQIDDANGDGVSDPVASSSYKTALKAALGLSTDASVQTIIDSAFDKLAANFTVTRLPGRPSVGQAVFYTTTAPTFDLTVPTGAIVSTTADSTLGIPSISYTVGGTYTMVAANAISYYNFTTKRYELTVDISAQTIGSNGNRPAGQITSSSGVNGLLVTNVASTVFGTDIESNDDLAVRAMLGFVSVDTGTEGGYAATSAAAIGIIKAKIVKSGDDLMMRDYDPVRNKHIGGKVDIWVQGVLERQVSETFAFTFEIANNIVCQIIDLPTLTLRVQDSRVTVNNPIIEILNNAPQGLGVRNVTQGINYDLTGAQIIDYQTFQINPALPLQPSTGIDDVIVADYRFRVVNQFQLTFQPVRRVVSVSGEVSGSLNPTLGYQLFKTGDPLLEGESTIAKDYLSINQVGGVPSGSTITKNAEEHVLIGAINEPLLSVGINTKTLRVFSLDRTIEYSGPDETVPDFEIIPGSPTTPISIVRASTSTIPNGATVSVDYVHDENFVVTYVINDLLQSLQTTVNSKRHVTADVIVKQAINNFVNIEDTIQLLPGAKKDRSDPAVRTALSNELDQKLIGQGTAQSDIIAAIDGSEGVDFSTVPLTLMGYADGSLKLREVLESNYVSLPSLSIGGNAAYILTTSLAYPTTDGGGLVTEHKGVFQDDVALVLAGSLSQVASASGQAFIVGAGGATIAGYTDLATLIAAGFTIPSTQQAELLLRTANRVVISLPAGASPANTPDLHTYTCSYVVRGDVGAKDITAATVEYLSLGSATLTFRAAT